MSNNAAGTQSQKAQSHQATFGGWLKQRRKEQGIGPDQLAELIGCSAITLLKIEAEVFVGSVWAELQSVEFEPKP